MTDSPAPPDPQSAADRSPEQEKICITSQAAAILSSLGDPCTIIDRDYTILYQNEVSKSLFGSHNGCFCYKAYFLRDTICEDCHSAKVFADGKIHKSEKSRLTENGENHVQVTSAPLTDSTGFIYAVVNIARDVTSQKLSEKGKERLIQELQAALSKVKRLSGLLPICSYCKKIRDDSGYWNQLESYFRSHADVEFSHGICEECAEKHHPGLFKKK